MKIPAAFASSALVGLLAVWLPLLDVCNGQASMCTETPCTYSYNGTCDDFFTASYVWQGDEYCCSFSEVNGACVMTTTSSCQWDSKDKYNCNPTTDTTCAMVGPAMLSVQTSDACPTSDFQVPYSSVWKDSNMPGATNGNGTHSAYPTDDDNTDDGKGMENDNVTAPANGFNPAGGDEVNTATDGNSTFTKPAEGHEYPKGPLKSTSGAYHFGTMASFVLLAVGAMATVIV